MSHGLVSLILLSKIGLVKIQRDLTVTDSKAKCVRQIPKNRQELFVVSILELAREKDQIPTIKLTIPYLCTRICQLCQPKPYQWSIPKGSYRTNYRIIFFVVKNVINYIILANTIFFIDKSAIRFLILAHRMAIM